MPDKSILQLRKYVTVLTPSTLVSKTGVKGAREKDRESIQSVRHLLVAKDDDRTKILGIITPTDFVGYLKENLNVDKELNARLLEFLKEPGEEVVQELEQEGKLRKDSQKGGQEYEDEKPRQG
jgi:hypothetical protein